MSYKKSLVAALSAACGLMLALAAHATAIYSSQEGGSFSSNRTFVEQERQPLVTTLGSWSGNSGPVALSEWLTDTFVLSGLSNYLNDRELANLLSEDRLIYGAGSTDRLAQLLGSGNRHKCGPGNESCECNKHGSSCKHKREVPEPGTLGLAAAALLGSAYLLVRRRRRATTDVVAVS